MSSPPFEIRHGQLLDVIGTPITHDGVTLVPAYVKLSGTSLSPVHRFVDWCESNSQAIPRVVGGDSNAPWVLGRLMALFSAENTPEEERPEKSCLHASFLAVLCDHNNLAIPFVCSDYYGRTSLFFSSEDAPTEAHQETIASSYYRLLLEEPTELVDYENRMLHSTSGEWIDFGVHRGESYLDADVPG